MSIGIGISISHVFWNAAPAGITLSAPALGFPTPQQVAPAAVSIQITIGIDWKSGDIVKLYKSSSANMASSTLVGTHTLSDTDVAGGSFSMGIGTLSSVTYFQAYGNRSGIDSTNLSNIVGWGSVTAPTITTTTPQSQMELLPMAVALTNTGNVVPALVSDGTKSGWYVSGGADQTQAQVAIVTGAANLQWINNGYETYGTPGGSAAGTNAYVVQVSAIDLFGNKSSLSITINLQQANKTPNAFTFNNVIPSTPSTQYTSNTITVSGLTNGISVSSSVGTSNYSKNGGPWTAPGSFTSMNGDTLTLQVTSGPGATDVKSSAVTVGTYSTTWTVSNTANTAAWTTTAGTSLNQNTTISGSPALTYATSTNLTTQLVRSNQSAAGKRYFEITLGSGLTGDFYCGIDDGTTSFGPSTSTVPGAANANGLLFENGTWGWDIKINSAVVAFSDYASGTKAPAAGDIIGFEFDTTAHTCTVWRNKSGTWTNLGTVSTNINFANYYAFGGCGNNGGSYCTATANFGQNAFGRTPTSGYIGYGN